MFVVWDPLSQRGTDKRHTCILSVFAEAREMLYLPQYGTDSRQNNAWRVQLSENYRPG